MWGVCRDIFWVVDWTYRHEKFLPSNNATDCKDDLTCRNPHGGAKAIKDSGPSTTSHDELFRERLELQTFMLFSWLRHQLALIPVTNQRCWWMGPVGASDKVCRMSSTLSAGEHSQWFDHSMERKLSWWCTLLHPPIGWNSYPPCKPSFNFNLPFAKATITYGLNQPSPMVQIQPSVKPTIFNKLFLTYGSNKPSVILNQPSLTNQHRETMRFNPRPLSVVVVVTAQGNKAFAAKSGRALGRCHHFGGKHRGTTGWRNGGRWTMGWLVD